MSVKKWVVADGDKDLAAELAQRHGVDPFAALLAVSRGVRTDAQMHAFFFGDDDTLSDPFAYRDMDKAVERIKIGRASCRERV